MYEQLRGGNIESTCYKVYLNIAMMGNVVIMGSREHERLEKKAERTN